MTEEFVSHEYVMAEVADRLRTDRLMLTCYHLWLEATPEASIIRSGCMVDIEAAPSPGAPRSERRI